MILVLIFWLRWNLIAFSTVKLVFFLCDYQIFWGKMLWNYANILFLIIQDFTHKFYHPWMVPACNNYYSAIYLMVISYVCCSFCIYLFVGILAYGRVVLFLTFICSFIHLFLYTNMDSWIFILFSGIKSRTNMFHFVV